jgi:hypothetical protein
MSWLYSFVGGVLLSTASVLLHNAFVPVGLILSLLGSGTGIWLIGKYFGGRRYKLVAVAGWIAVLLRAASPGIGGELLIEGNAMGNALVVGGFITLLLSLLTRN